MPRAIGPTFELAPSERVLELLEERLREAPAKTQKVALAVLRRSLRTGKTAASKKIRERVPLRKKLIDDRIRTKVISQRGVIGSLQARGSKFELIDYMTRGQIATAWRRQNARTRRSKGPRIKVYKDEPSKVFEGYFVNIGRQSGRWHVLKRRYSSQRDSHEIQYGPSIIKDFLKALPKFAERQSANFERELERVLRQKVQLV